MSIPSFRTRTLSLRRSFLVAILVLYVLTTVAAVVVFVRTTERVTAEYVQRYAVSQNLLERNRILAIIDRDAALSLKLADDPAVRGWILDEQHPEKQQVAMEQLESYRRLFRDHSYFVAVAETLSYYVHTPETGGVEHTTMQPDAPHDRWFFATLESERDFWINVDFNALLNEVRVWINSLVRGSDGTLLGAAGTGMDLSEFLEALVDHDAPGISTIITNADGQILAHRDRELIEHNARVERDQDRIDLLSLVPQQADQELLSDALARVRARYASSESVQSLTLEIDGVPVTVAVGFLPELDWFNLVLVEEGQIIGPAEFSPLLLTSVLSLLGVSALVLLLLNRLVLSPLDRLDRAAQQLAEGNYDIELRPERANEIGRVSDSFRSMSAKIREYTGNLEQMVFERTRELQESQDRIMESIRYGRLIQSSIMPPETEMRQHLSESFLIHEPLDTVGGDFAYFRPMTQGFCIAVVDCTGHGVPGAFMTMLVSAVLNRIMETDTGAKGTDQMLIELHAHVQDGLRAAEDTSYLDNGLDIALCRYCADSNEIEFSGAGLPLLYCDRNQGAVQRIDGDRVRLGFRSTEREPMITRRRIEVRSDRQFYLLSDGVLDLPGGEQGFGLGFRGLTAILEQSADLPLSEQAGAIRSALNQHNAGRDSRDDIILLGFSLP